MSRKSVSDSPLKDEIFEAGLAARLNLGRKALARLTQLWPDITNSL
jgi:hypothetical protein